MNQPGLSLFQGAGSLHLNQSAQRQEDEEELLDQQRRREEVQNRLDNEFGDLSDDNDDTTASEYHVPPRYPLQQQQHQQQPAVIIAAAASPAQTPLTSKPFGQYQPKNAENMPPPAYDERGELLAKFKDQQELEELRRRLALCESEKQRAFMARQQSHELLVESKGKISEQEDTIQKLKTKLKSIEHTNVELATQLECKQTMLNDALLKQQMIERSVGLTADRNADLAVKQANDRCAAQAAMHQQQLDSLRTQLADREQEMKTLNSRYVELQRSREALLVEKSETINQLSKSIEDSQRQNQQLMARGDGYEENARLRSTVDQMCGQIAQLERSLQTANAEITSMTSLLHDSGHETGKPLGKAHHMPNSSTPILQDTTTRLRTELSRSLADQKERRIELKQLQQQLNECHAEISTLKSAENRLLVQLETLKAEAHRAGTQMKHLCGDLERLFRMHGRADEVSSASADKVIDAIELEYERTMCEQDQLKNQVMQLQAECQEARHSGETHDNGTASALRQAQTACNALRQQYTELLATKEALSQELAEMRSSDVRQEYNAQTMKLAGVEEMLRDSNEKCRHYQQEMADLTRTYDAKLAALTEKLKTETNQTNISAEMHKTDIELRQLRNDCANYRHEIATLSAQLKHSGETISDLRQSIALKQDNDKLLADLQAKAQRFDQYIQQQQSNVAANASPSTPERCASAPTQHTKTPGSASASPARRSTDEARMAAVLAKKLKAIEDVAKAEEARLRLAIGELDEQLHCVRDALEIRDHEVHLLKQAILAERVKAKEIMEERDTEVGEMFEKQQAIVDNYRERLDGAQDSIQRLNERLAMLAEERKTAQKTHDRLVMDKERLKAERDRQDNERQSERELAAQTESVLRQQLGELELAKDALLQEWERKYRAAKKTAASYKKYAEDKDLHIERENERIRAEYKRAIEKIQDNVENIARNN